MSGYARSGKARFNKKGSAVIVIIIVLLVVFALGLLAWNLWLSKSLEKIGGKNKSAKQTELAKSVDERMAGESEDEGKIVINSPQKGELISSPLSISGQINGDGWSGFERQAGTVKLLDENGKVLGTAILVPTTDWMRLPTKFKATLKFSSPKAQSGMLVFKNENPSDMPENNREFGLAVKIEKTK